MRAMRRGLGNGQGHASARLRPDPAAILALISLAAFLGVTLLAPLHVHEHGGAVARDLLASCGHPAHEQDASPDPASSEDPPDPASQGDPHDCPICQLASESRAPLPVEPVPPPRAAEARAVALPEAETAPSSPRFRSARPRAPPLLAR